MIQLVIALNLAIALFGFFVAWRLWQIKRVLVKATVALTLWEQNTHWALNPATTPKLILRGQTGTASLREKYGRLERQLQQLERIFAIALIGLRFFPGLRRARTVRWLRR